MKHFLTIFLFLYIVLNGFSQTLIIPIDSDYDSDDLVPGCYIKDVRNKYAPFIGTWIWSDGSNELTITFEKLMIVYDDPKIGYADWLIGRYKYIEDGVEIINTLDHEIEGFDVHVPLSGSYRTDSKVSIGVWDFIHEKGGKGSFEIDLFTTDPDEPMTGHLKFRNRESFIFDGSDPPPAGFSIPADVILTKVE